MVAPVRSVKTEHEVASPVSLTEAKQHLALFDDNNFDAYIMRLLITATSVVGDHIGRPLDQARFVDYYSAADPRFDLSSAAIEGAPVSVQFYDSDNTLQDVPSENYIIDETGTTPALVFTTPLVSLGVASTVIENPYIVTYDSLDIPSGTQEAIKQAILMYVGDMFKYRENDAEASLNRVSVNAEFLLGPYRSELI